MRVIVLTVRGLRLAALGLYGNGWIETPALDELAASSVVFDWHFADAADSVGARRAWRSGRYCFRSRGGEPEVPIKRSDDLLAQLQRKGIHTCLLVDRSRPLAAEMDGPGAFAQGWDEVHRIAASGTETSLENALRVSQEVLAKLMNRDDWLVWLDLATVLPPWDVPDEFLQPYFEPEVPAEEESDPDTDAEPVKAEVEPEPIVNPVLGPVDAADDRIFRGLWQTYAAAVSYLDAGVGQLLEKLQEHSETPVVVIVTADHGFPLGEHGYVGPARAWAHEERIHLPLVVRWPDYAARRVDALTQTVDLAPTLAALYGVSLPAAQGQDLRPLADAKVQAIREYACCAVEDDEAMEWCLRTEDFALLVPVRLAPWDSARSAKLYIKPDDPWEVNDVAQHHQDRIEGLQKTLHEFAAASRTPGPFQPPPLLANEAKNEARASAEDTGQ